jgi:hypothetical protein
MSVAQIIRLDERQPMGRARRTLQESTPCLILPFPRSRSATPAMMVSSGDDRTAARGHDPG